MNRQSNFKIIITFLSIKAKELNIPIRLNVVGQTTFKYIYFFPSTFSINKFFVEN